MKQTAENFARYEVLTVIPVLQKIKVFWDVILCCHSTRIWKNLTEKKLQVLLTKSRIYSTRRLLRHNYWTPAWVTLL